jgi:hypothetical protein
MLAQILRLRLAVFVYKIIQMLNYHKYCMLRGLKLCQRGLDRSMKTLMMFIHLIPSRR